MMMTSPSQAASQRSPLSVKQQAGDLQVSRDQLREKSLVDSFSVATSMASEQEQPIKPQQKFFPTEEAIEESKTDDAKDNRICDFQTLIFPT